MNAETIISELSLQPLPHEGGWFRRVHTDQRQLPPTKSSPPRAVASAIYYLITQDGFSALHRLIDSAETFHWHAGDSVELLMLHGDGSGEKCRLGMSLAAGDQPMAVVPTGSWQGSRLADGAQFGFALLSVVVTPEFLWEDFILGDRDDLVKGWPDWHEEIVHLTR
ncbi:MAG: cupin domain-containing protein [Verrucomicrobiota bacterium]